jgi:ATP-dependent Clp protease ATP-binding subunit ClpA
MLSKIAEIEISKYVKIIAQEQNIEISYDWSLISYIVEKWRDPAFGARPLKRAVQKYFLDKLALELLEWKYKEGASLKISIENNEIVFSPAVI